MLRSTLLPRNGRAFAVGAWRRHGVAAALAMAAVGIVRSASAEPTPEDRALAAVLFDEGRALLAAGTIAEACSKLETSQRLDPGGGTLLNLALCHEAQGRTATAYVELVEARGVARRDGRSDREALAQEHLDAITPRLSYLVVRVPDAAVPGLRVTRDGSDLAPSAWGVRAPVDPGTHRVEASAPGFAPFSRDVAVEGEAQVVEVAIPALAPLPAAAPLPTAAPPPARVAVVVPPRAAPLPPRADEGVGPLRAGSLVAGGLAVVGLAVGAVGAAVAMDEESESEAIGGDCITGCPPAAVEHSESAQTAADVATVGFVAAGVLATTAVVLWLVGDETPAASPVRAHRRALALRF